MAQTQPQPAHQLTWLATVAAVAELINLEFGIHLTRTGTT